MLRCQIVLFSHVIITTASILYPSYVIHRCANLILLTTSKLLIRKRVVEGPVDGNAGCMHHEYKSRIIGVVDVDVGILMNLLRTRIFRDDWNLKKTNSGWMIFEDESYLWSRVFVWKGWIMLWILLRIRSPTEALSSWRGGFVNESCHTSEVCPLCLAFADAIQPFSQGWSSRWFQL